MCRSAIAVTWVYPVGDCVQPSVTVIAIDCRVSCYLAVPCPFGAVCEQAFLCFVYCLGCLHQSGACTVCWLPYVLSLFPVAKTLEQRRHQPVFRLPYVLCFVPVAKKISERQAQACVPASLCFLYWLKSVYGVPVFCVLFRLQKY